MRGAHPIQGDARSLLRSAEVGVDAGRQAAPPALGHDATQWGGVQINLAGDEELVDGAQRRRRQPGRCPAARGLRGSHRRSRSSHVAQFVQVDARGRHDSPNLRRSEAGTFGPLIRRFLHRGLSSRGPITTMVQNSASEHRRLRWLVPADRTQTCTQAHKDGRWDIPKGDPDYWPAGDRDNDGVACES